MPRLSVNVNKIALLRNARVGRGPDVLALAEVALAAGAHGITVHPRPDRRHVVPSDVLDLRDLLSRPDFRHAELNIEGNPFEGDYLDILARTRPDQATLVPDSPGQSTSDHGFCFPADLARLREVVPKVRRHARRVSLFMDADPRQITLAAETGCDRVELYTGPWAQAWDCRGEDPEAYAEAGRRFAAAAAAARSADLGLNAGHDLDLHNLRPLLTAAGTVDEVSIGHALIGDALRWGLDATVKKYLVEVTG